MARAVTWIMLVVSCAVLAADAGHPLCVSTFSIKLVQERRYITQAFGPSERLWTKANGYVTNAKLYENGSLSGYLSGLEFLSSDDIEHQVFTIRFKDADDKDEGTTKETKLFLRGTSASEFDQFHEFGVVGGTKLLSGAFGTLTFRNDPATRGSLIEGTIFVPDVNCSGDSTLKLQLVS